MGILDSKSRILDTIITEEGRKQLSVGEFNIEFAAFSDKFTYYEEDAVSGSSDASERLYFEAISLPQDRITFEADDSGRLLFLEAKGNLGITKGKIISGSSSVYKTIVSNTEFSSLSNEIISSSIDNFDKLRIIGSKDLVFDTENFNLSKDSIDFEITQISPIPPRAIQKISVDAIESLFQDKRLSHIPNFQFLPPINKPTIEEPEGSLLGNYMPIEQESYAAKAYENSGNNSRPEYSVLLEQLDGKPFETIHFTETSRFNNIFGQFFEVGNQNMTKLEVIDFGTFPSIDPRVPDPHVFFVGKVFLDSFGRHTFVNIFTLIFE